jgi:hypothetical protein
MSLIRNRICDKLADHRVLGALALFFFTTPVIMALRESSTHAQGAPRRPAGQVSPGRPAEGGEGPPAVSDPESVHDGGPTLDGLYGEVRGRLLPAPEIADVPEEAPGDFLTDLSAAFEAGEASGLVRLRTDDEVRIFHLWREALGGRNVSEDVTLRRVEQHPDGIERYEIAINLAGIRGWITFKQHRNRWYIVGVKDKKREKMEAEPQDLDKFLERLKLKGGEDLRGPEPQLPREKGERP